MYHVNSIIMRRLGKGTGGGDRLPLYGFFYMQMQFDTCVVYYNHVMRNQDRRERTNIVVEGSAARSLQKKVIN